MTSPTLLRAFFTLCALALLVGCAEVETQPANPEIIATETDSVTLAQVDPIDDAVELEPDGTPAAPSEPTK